MSICGVSDRRADARARLTARLVDFAGNELTRFDQDIALAANASRAYMTFRKRDVLKGADPTKVVLVTELEVDGARGRVVAQPALLQEDEGPALPKPEIKLAVAAGANGALAVSVSAKQLARNVFLASGAIDGFFDDNYFDVLPGETVTVTFSPRARDDAGRAAGRADRDARSPTPTYDRRLP